MAVAGRVRRLRQPPEVLHAEDELVHGLVQRRLSKWLAFFKTLFGRVCVLQAFHILFPFFSVFSFRNVFSFKEQIAEVSP